MKFSISLKGLKLYLQISLALMNAVTLNMCKPPPNHFLVLFTLSVLPVYCLNCKEDKC